MRPPDTGEAAPDELPPIHVVLIAPGHYDSLDRGGAETRFIVPPGIARWFRRLGITNVTELDRWEHCRHGGILITAVPTQHWGKRRLFSRNQPLWAGWALHTPDLRFLFVGDTGYTSALRARGRAARPVRAGRHSHRRLRTALVHGQP